MWVLKSKTNILWTSTWITTSDSSCHHLFKHLTLTFFVCGAGIPGLVWISRNESCVYQLWSANHQKITSIGIKSSCFDVSKAFGLWYDWWWYSCRSLFFWSSDLNKEAHNSDWNRRQGYSVSKGDLHAKSLITGLIDCTSYLLFI